jgi:hypothetical protein
MQRRLGFLVELICVGCIISSSFDVAFVFVLSVLHLLLLSRSYMFVFRHAHNSLATLLCFRGFLSLFFVVHAIMLMLHCVSKVFAILLVCEFFIQHLILPPATPLCSRFQYNRHVYVSSHDLHGFNSITVFCASQMLLHCNHYCIADSICSCIVDSSKLQVFLHCNCLYIVDSFVAWNLFYFCNLCCF